ncbi:MAG: hypothetical protein U1D30_21540 [Planctomycetota bacterium]
MTLFGKIVVLVNLSLSFLFLGFATFVYRSRVDLAGELRTARSKVSELQNRRTTTEEENTRLTQILDADKARLAQATKDNETNAAERNTKIEDLSSQLEQNRQRIAEAQETFHRTAAQQTERRQEVERLRGVLANLDQQINDLEAQKTSLNNQLAQTTNNLVESQTREAELAKRVSELEGLSSGSN